MTKTTVKSSEEQISNRLSTRGKFIIGREIRVLEVDRQSAEHARH